MDGFLFFDSSNPFCLLFIEFHRTFSISYKMLSYYTISGRIGKVVASHADGCKVDSRLRMHRFILCTRRSGGTAHEGGGVRPVNWIYRL